MNFSKEHMGLNLPMLLANSQNLDSWNTAGQYSPPIVADRPHITSSIITTTTTTTTTTAAATTTTTAAASNASVITSNAMRIQIPTITAFSNSPTHTHDLKMGVRSLFGSSSNTSELTASPHKPMDATDMEDIKDENAAKQERLQGSPRNTVNASTSIGGSGEGGSEIDIAACSPNKNEAHLHIHHTGLLQLPYHAHAHAHAHPHAQINLPQHTHTHTHPHNMSGSRQTESREQDDMDIKQELVDYFHVAGPPLPAIIESNRSYSSTEELHANADEYAQDLRVAAAKGLEFGNFVLPRNLRPARSSPAESMDEKYTPLNMRKLNVSNSSSVAAAAGNVLMNSLLSNESMSEENITNAGRLKRSASQDAAAAAAIYADSLTNRDDCDFVGSNVTIKLRAMDRTQRIIAEKLISEVLFYGQFNELERNAHIQPK